MPSGTDYPHSTVSVGSSATFICTVAPVDTQAILKNRGPDTAYIGGSTVTADASATGGYPLNPDEQIILPSCPSTTPGLDVYAIVASGNAAYISQINV